MLLLIESILLQRNSKSTFPSTYAQKARNVHSLMTYPWGGEAYILLKNSIINAVDNRMEKRRLELQGFPLAFQIWILESIPLLQSRFSDVIPIERPRHPLVTYLCEKYISTDSPMLIQITVVQKDANLKVACILPAIPNDPEGEVSLEGEYSEELENMADISKRGYKFKITDWASRTVNVHDALFEMTGAAGAPLQFEHVEVGESSTPNGESVIGKINKIVETMEKKFKLMKDRVCFLEEENRELKERVSEEPLTGLPASPLSQINETQDFSPNLTRHVCAKNILFLQFVCV
ncbi:hypothetical protein Bca101_042708 [Brassica carinata]